MDLQLPLPIRLAAPVSHIEATATPEPPSPPSAATGEAAAPAPVQSPSPSPLDASARSPISLIADDAAAAAAGDSSYAPIPISPSLRAQQASSIGPSSHQFWLKDAKIAEELFTLHRSAQDLVNFASSIIGNRESTLGQRPIPVMSDGDVLFMTELSKDIVRSVNGITAVRQHGTRMRKRKIKHGHAAAPREYSMQRPREDTAAGTGAPKRLRLSIEEDQLQRCYKCGRTETPEWRKGPDGLLCNSCGLVYAKQKRKQKMANKVEKDDKADMVDKAGMQ